MKTKAEIAQEMFDFNSRSLESRTTHKPATDAPYGAASTAVAFMHSDDREVMSIYEDLCFEHQERERQRRRRREYFTMMLTIIGSGDKSFGMQELIER